MLLDPQKLPCLKNYTIKVAIVRFKTVGYGIRSIYSKTLLSIDVLRMMEKITQNLRHLL